MSCRTWCSRQLKFWWKMESCTTTRFKHLGTKIWVLIPVLTASFLSMCRCEEVLLWKACLLQVYCQHCGNMVWGSRDHQWLQWKFTSKNRYPPSYVSSVKVVALIYSIDDAEGAKSTEAITVVEWMPLMYSIIAWFKSQLFLRTLTFS